ncbi:MAG TPA: phosphoenolpyruvate--protein phosphotransferase [Usitatibacter sp.]|nr:phosphoenolpyruvate--protein phosphotransferase [Usitatibacter sp.]
MTRSLLIAAPLQGWALPLGEVPDPVFAERMAGDGVAIDPTAGILHAPCDGEVLDMKGARHAVTLRSALGIDILMHVGIDTVKLDGQGFVPLAAVGTHVSQGQPLLRFDLDLVARRAPSLVTPVVLASPGSILRRTIHRAVRVGDVLMEIVDGAAAPAREDFTEETRREFGVPFEHGLHVRPAALIAAALRPFGSEVTVVFRGRAVNARSTVAMMSLGVHCGDTIEVRAVGGDGIRALEALEPLLSQPAARAAPRRETPKVTGHRRVEAAIASRGLAVGRAVQWTRTEIAVAERGGGEEGESTALDRALEKLRAHLESAQAGVQGEHRALLAAHAELAADPDLRDRAGEWLRRGKSAAFAWRQSTRAVADALGALDDPRMRERAADLRDLEGQVLRILAGKPPSSTREFAPGTVLLADDVLPSQMVSLDLERVVGVCTARGGPTSHVALLAAANGLPMLVAAGPTVLDVADGTEVVLDAEHGWLDVQAPADELAAARRLLEERVEERTADLATAGESAATRDGVAIAVLANLGSVADARVAMQRGAGGCGLLRTEFLYLERREPPTEDEQAAEYQRIAETLEGRPLSIRTMDIGGDKPIPYLPLPREDNPALGMRGVRASLWRPELLRAQLRAIVRVKPAGQCRVLLPMITEVSELVSIRALLNECARELELPEPALGVMIETPSSALIAEQLAEHADFLSLGTNDLSQYTLAIDRAHPELARRLDALHPAVLRLIALVADAGRAHGRSVSVCGALGSDVEALPILVGLGIHEVSATPSMIPRLKRTARELDARRCAGIARRALEQTTAAEVRALAAEALAAEPAPTETMFGGWP